MDLGCDHEPQRGVPIGSFLGCREGECSLGKKARPSSLSRESRGRERDVSVRCRISPATRYRTRGGAHQVAGVRQGEKW